MSDTAVTIDTANAGAATSSTNDVTGGDAISRRTSTRPRKEPKYRLVSSSAASNSGASLSEVAAAAYLQGAASTVSRRTRALKQHQLSNPLRRRMPIKAPPAGSATAVRHRSWLFHRGGEYLQLGDIVSVAEDHSASDSRKYYAQIRALILSGDLTPGCQVTWLLPRTASTAAAACFDPAAYELGPRDEAVRPLDGLTFVCHCPGDYYSGAGQAGGLAERPGYVWTTLGREIPAGR